MGSSPSWATAARAASRSSSVVALAAAATARAAAGLRFDSWRATSAASLLAPRIGLASAGSGVGGASACAGANPPSVSTPTEKSARAPYSVEPSAKEPLAPFGEASTAELS